jgi:hypothetical protein
MIYEMISGVNPFKVKNKTKFEKLQMITEGKIPFFPIFSSNAKSILKGLLASDVSLLNLFSDLEFKPRHRLGFGPNGIQQIKDHHFFEGINWEHIYTKKYEIPDFQPYDLTAVNKMDDENSALFV